MGNILSDLRRFLDAARYEGARHIRPDLKRGVYPFLTISRQYGAGGRTLATAVLKELAQRSSPVLAGWKIFDRDLCETIVEDPEMLRSIEALLSEEYQSEVEALVYSLLGKSTPHSAAADRLFETILTLASFGKVIIIGRAGACVTESLPLGVHVRLTASVDSRGKRSGLEEMTEEEALKTLRRKDQDRAKLVKIFFQRDIADPELYDLQFNTDRISFPLIARLVVDLIQARWEERTSDHKRFLP